MRGAKGYKMLPYTPYGLKLGVEFNRGRFCAFFDPGSGAKYCFIIIIF